MDDDKNNPEHVGDIGRQTSASSPRSDSKAKHSSPITIKQPSTSRAGLNQTHVSSSPKGIVLDSGKEQVPIDKIIRTANTMSSMMMAHRIALEDDFKLEPGMDMSGPMMSISPIIGSSPKTGSAIESEKSEPTLQSKVKHIIHDAYWDLFEEELNTRLSSTINEDKKYDLSKKILDDIRQKINDLLLPQHIRLRQDVEDKFDTKIIDQLCRAGALDLLDYAKFTLNVLSKLCAPIRDEKLKELDETTEVVKLYRGIMELLELMRLDFANFTLNRFKPHIKAHSQEYEREKFKEVLKQQQSIGIDGLEYTKVWLNRAVQRLDAAHGLADLINHSPDPELGNHAELSVQNDLGTTSEEDKILCSDIVNKVLNAGYCELLEWTPDKQALYPETLLFDEATFKQLADQYKVLILTSSILLTTFAFVNRYKLHTNEEFRVLVKSRVITLLTASYDNQTDPTAGSSKEADVESDLDQVKLETIAIRLIEDIKDKLRGLDQAKLEDFEGQKELFRRQILDLQSPSNRIRELARRRILEFIETLLVLDVQHQRKKFSSKLAPSVNIPLGLNCLADEITLTMAQLVKIIRYNRRVFSQHYQDIVVDIIRELIAKGQLKI